MHRSGNSGLLSRNFHSKPTVLGELAAVVLSRFEATIFVFNWAYQVAHELVQNWAKGGCRLGGPKIQFEQEIRSSPCEPIRGFWACWDHRGPAGPPSSALGVKNSLSENRCTSTLWGAARCFRWLLLLSTHLPSDLVFSIGPSASVWCPQRTAPADHLRWL